MSVAKKTFLLMLGMPLAVVWLKQVVLLAYIMNDMVGVAQAV